MLYLLRRHPFPVKAHFHRCLALTYAFPAKLLAGLLPPGLAVDTYGEFGFVAIALVETRNLRPAFLPSWLGQDFFLCGYRIFTRLSGGTGALRGLYILRSDTDRALMSYLGNVFTHYRYYLGDVTCERSGSVSRWKVSTRGGEADLSVSVDFEATKTRLPEGSPFPDFKVARRFAGPLPYTFDFEPQTGSIISVRGTRGEWNPQPASVAVDALAFFNRAPFNAVQPLLANAFYVQDVGYGWDRGRRVATAQSVGAS